MEVYQQKNQKRNKKSTAMNTNPTMGNKLQKSGRTKKKAEIELNSVLLVLLVCYQIKAFTKETEKEKKCSGFWAVARDTSRGSTNIHTSIEEKSSDKNMTINQTVSLNLFFKYV